MSAEPTAPVPRQASTPALLTNEALRAVAGADANQSLTAALRFWQTEGREALVEKVESAIFTTTYVTPEESRATAEAVVTALIGESS